MMHKRCVILIAAVTFVAFAVSDAFSAGGRAQFGLAVRLPSRLTAFNMYDDVARAVYSCCRPDQKEQIELALRAIDDFLNLYPDSDFVPYMFMYRARLYGLLRDARKVIEALHALVERFPHSDLADDALWMLAQRYERDFVADKVTRARLLERLANEYPNSIYADNALCALVRLYSGERMEERALQALERLLNEHPYSPCCDDAVWDVANKYREYGNYEAAIKMYERLIKNYPFSPHVDDASLAIGRCYRSMNLDGVALRSYETFINSFPGSPFVREAVREINEIMKRSQRTLAMTFPADIADDLFNEAKHFQAMGQYNAAVQAYRRFLATMYGHDKWSEALFNIGKCYQAMEVLIDKFARAAGPEEIYRLLPDWRAAVGNPMASTPNIENWQRANSAVAAFQMVARLTGSPLQVSALYEIAQCYWQLGDEEKEALALQQLLTAFPGCGYDAEAWYKVLRYYQNPENYPECLKAYESLSRAFPTIFPPKLGQNKETFLKVMRHYYRVAERAWLEGERHHIGYAIGADDLTDDSLFVGGAISLEIGDTKGARERLKRLVDLCPTGELYVPAAFLLARAYELSGDRKNAIRTYQQILQRYPECGLSDDIEEALTRLGGDGAQPLIERIGKWMEVVKRKLRGELGWQLADLWEGKRVVVLMPFEVSAWVRQYNLPNTWEAASVCLAEWTGCDIATNEPILIVLADGIGGHPRNVIPMSKSQVGDPPAWHLGFRELTRAFISSDELGWNALGETKPIWMEAFSRLGAGALQYALVSETRDTIGSPSAIKLPHEEVVRMRERAINSLVQYVRQGADLTRLNPDVALGMLIYLLEANGYGQELIDWSPYQRFFNFMRTKRNDAATAGSWVEVFSEALKHTFRNDLSGLLSTWGFPARSTRM
ncbi:MAG: tetratricopeptide repeat protein [Armatimonadota bacterium]|nr:tetratricopeptide repeat protein [Armatimonadota bacterium]MCX7776574.1 tetratricopeptide repeat protein [Armatimonadota bacterium]MDW8026092.1 tetratricopeptide repeat protein [Armatimonadota bacterium]